jgi:serine/threonine protein kinase
MKLDSPQVEAVDDLTSTTLAHHDAPTPVDIRTRHDEVAAPMPIVGDVVLERYRIVAWAGLGTGTVVFRGEHLELPCSVAIKIVSRQDFPERAVVTGHLRNEAMLLARLRHANLARLWDFSETGKYPCLVTEFIGGQTLRQAIQLEGRIEQRWAVRAALHIADVLVAVGRAGVVHRDIKPENIVLSADGAAKLIDFGLAVVLGRENPDARGEHLAVPRVGTVAYLAPEQAKNSAAVDQRADIYSLGATLYHAVTGRLPFTGNNAAQVLLRHMQEDPAPPRSIVPHLNESLSDLILRMMAKRPRDRFVDARELLESLQAVQDSLID